MPTFIKNFGNLGAQPSQPTKRYIDVDLQFNKHPSGDIAVKVDTRAIAQSLRNICLTTPGDIDEEPEFGVGVWSMLGENYTPIEIVAIKDKIYEQCSRYEPRAEITDVVVAHDITNYTVRIRIKYYPINVDQEESVDISVERLL